MTHIRSLPREIFSLADRSGRILIAADLDGTLCPITNTPSEVELPCWTAHTLRRAARCEGLTMAVISGREMADLRSRIRANVIYSGNHGLEIAGRGLHFEHATAREHRPLIFEACKSLAPVLREWTPAWVEFKGLSATLHFRDVPATEHRSLLHTARQLLGVFGPRVAFRVGKMALDIRLRIDWDKGSAVSYIREKTGPYDACICIGDDRTDESMFRANRGQINIRIGDAKHTAATYWVDDPVEMGIMLRDIVDLCISRARSPRFNGWRLAEAEPSRVQTAGAQQ